MFVLPLILQVCVILSSMDVNKSVLTLRKVIIAAVTKVFLYYKMESLVSVGICMIKYT